MIKSQTMLEIKKNERTYQLHLSSESPLGEIHDVLHEMVGFIVNTMNQRVKPKEEEKVIQIEDKIYDEPKEDVS